MNVTVAEVPEYANGWTCDTCRKLHPSKRTTTTTIAAVSHAGAGDADDGGGGGGEGGGVRKLCLALARHLAMLDEMDAIEQLPAHREQCVATHTMRTQVTTHAVTHMHVMHTRVCARVHTHMLMYCIFTQARMLVHFTCLQACILSC